MSEISSSNDLGSEVSGEGLGVFEGANFSETVNQIVEVPELDPQTAVENFHDQSIEQILDLNSEYFSDSDRERVAGGVDSIRAVEYDPYSFTTGRYSFSEGTSRIEVSVINEKQLERSSVHETNHFASKNREIIVPEPEKGGYTTYRTVGLHQSSIFHSAETGENFLIESKGRGLNEGLTTHYTNEQLWQKDPELGKAAERQNIYAHATELTKQLEAIVGKDTLKEAYYGGKIETLREKVDELSGKGFDALRGTTR